jgi:hypothetical protein
VKPIKKVAEIFSTKNAKMLELTIPVIKGFSSEAPKYITPIIVVKQSIEPNRIIKKLGNTSVFEVYIEAFSFSLRPSFSKHSLIQCLKSKLLNSIYSKIKKAKIFLNKHY